MTRASDAWAARSSVPVPVLIAGDSVSEGTGATTFEAKWTTRLTRALQADAGIAGGCGFVNNGSYSPEDGGLGSFYSPVAPVQGEGFVARRSGQTAADVAQTITFTGTSVDVHHFGSGQTHTVTLDGSSLGNVTPPSAPIDGSTLRYRWHSPVVAHGTHTLVLTPASGQQLYVRGIHVYDGDETNGIHGHEAGHFGTTSSIVADLVESYYADACAVWQPALVVVFLGLNDSGGGVLPATYGSNLAAIIAGIDSFCEVPPSYVLCAPYARPDTPSPAYPQSAYVAAVEAVVAADATNRRAVDLGTAGLTTGDLPDGVHPNNAGHAKIAAAVRPAALELFAAEAPTADDWTTVAAERWDGATWVPVVAEEWTGSAWVPAVLERAV